MRPRSRVQDGVESAHEHTGHTGITRHSPRNGFNGFLRALPGDRAFLPPSPAKVTFRELDTSVGVSGPHDFSVRLSAVRYRRIRVHRIPSRGRDDRDSPLFRDGTAANIALICISEKQNIFSEGAGQNGQIRAWGASVLPVG